MAVAPHERGLIELISDWARVYSWVWIWDISPETPLSVRGFSDWRRSMATSIGLGFRLCCNQVVGLDSGGALR